MGTKKDSKGSNPFLDAEAEDRAAYERSVKLGIDSERENARKAYKQRDEAKYKLRTATAELARLQADRIESLRTMYEAGLVQDFKLPAPIMDITGASMSLLMDSMIRVAESQDKIVQRLDCPHVVIERLRTLPSPAWAPAPVFSRNCGFMGTYAGTEVYLDNHLSALGSPITLPFADVGICRDGADQKDGDDRVLVRAYMVEMVTSAPTAWMTTPKQAIEAPLDLTKAFDDTTTPVLGSGGCLPFFEAIDRIVKDRIEKERPTLLDSSAKAAWGACYPYAPHQIGKAHGRLMGSPHYCQWSHQTSGDQIVCIHGHLAPAAELVPAETQEVVRYRTFRIADLGNFLTMVNAVEETAKGLAEEILKREPLQLGKMYAIPAHRPEKLQVGYVIGYKIVPKEGSPPAPAGQVPETKTKPVVVREQKPAWVVQAEKEGMNVAATFDGKEYRWIVQEKEK